MKKQLIFVFIALGFLSLILALFGLFFQKGNMNLLAASILYISASLAIIFVSIRFLLKNKSLKENVFFGGFSVGVLLVLASPILQNFNVFFAGLALMISVLIIAFIYLLFTYENFNQIKPIYKFSIIGLVLSLTCMGFGFGYFQSILVYIGLGILTLVIASIFVYLLRTEEVN